MMKEISVKGEEQRRIKDKIDDLLRDSSLLSREIGQLVQIQDRGTIQHRSLKKLAEQLRSKKELANLAQIEQELKNLEGRIKGAEEPLMNLMDQQTEITDKISNLNETGQKLEEDVRDLENQIQACDEGGDPSVKVRDSILSRTLIQGRCIHLFTWEGTSEMSSYEKN